MSGGHYCRVYYALKDEYPEVWRDDRALATWLRLLMLADASWPMKPPLPRSVYRKALEPLLRVGLVVLDGEHYEMRGLAAERLRRQERAAAGGRARAQRKQSDSTATAEHEQSDSTAIGLPRRDETRRDEQSKDETRRAAARDPVVAYMKLTGQGRPPEGGYLEQKLRANSERYGFDEWLFSLNQAREIYGTRNDIKNAEVIAEERFIAAKQRAEDERRAALPKVSPEQAAENAARVREITAQLTRREPPKEAA